MRLSSLAFLLALPFTLAAAPLAPEVADVSFSPLLEKPGALAAAKIPAWILRIEQQGGRFVAEPACWQVGAMEPTGAGRISITLDREKMKEDLVATILFEASPTADLAVQLFDGQGRVVEVDLFGNLVDVGREATTDTYVIPLRKYPTAERIVLRRIEGDVKVYGIVLYPAVSDGVPNEEALKRLANVLGDPLSPENPLLKGLQQVARGAKIDLAPVPAVEATPLPDVPVERGIYPGAVPPPVGTKVPPVPADGLVGYWNFDRADGTDASGHGHDGELHRGATFSSGSHGSALRLRKNPSIMPGDSWDSVTVAPSPELDLRETITVSAWVKYSSIADRWGSQIVWFGDDQLGRDPWTLHLFPDGTLEFRSDRSVTGKPIFTVFDNEIQLTATGEPLANQHVSVWSPKTLAPDTWYFVAGTIEKVTPRSRAFRLFVNGDLVGQVKTAETVNYATDKMWMTIGAVDAGTWQNFDGAIDEVRIYNRALTSTEIKALYRQPWTQKVAKPLAN